MPTQNPTKHKYLPHNLVCVTRKCTQQQNVVYYMIITTKAKLPPESIAPFCNVLPVTHFVSPLYNMQFDLSICARSYAVIFAAVINLLRTVHRKTIECHGSGRKTRTKKNTRTSSVQKHHQKQPPAMHISCSAITLPTCVCCHQHARISCPCMHMHAYAYFTARIKNQAQHAANAPYAPRTHATHTTYRKQHSS